MTVRQVIVDAITPLLPEGWLVVPYSTEPNVLDQEVVMVTSTTIDAGAMFGTYNIGLHVYVLVPPQDGTEGDDFDAADDAVLLLLHALRTINAVTQGSAERGVFSGNPGWDISLNFEASITDEEAG